MSDEVLSHLQHVWRQPVSMFAPQCLFTRSSWRLNRPQSDILCVINKHFFHQSGGWGSVWSWALQLAAVCRQNYGGISEFCVGNLSLIRSYYFSTLASRFSLCVIMMIENVTLCVEDRQSKSTLLRIIIHEVVQLFQTPASTCDYITMQTLSSTVHSRDCCTSPLCGRPLPPDQRPPLSHLRACGVTLQSLHGNMAVMLWNVTLQSLTDAASRCRALIHGGGK